MNVLKLPICIIIIIVFYFNFIFIALLIINVVDFIVFVWLYVIQNQKTLLIPEGIACAISLKQNTKRGQISCNRTAADSCYTKLLLNFKSVIFYSSILLYF